MPFYAMNNEVKKASATQTTARDFAKRKRGVHEPDMADNLHFLATKRTCL
jgi:hypothetical protein